MEFYKYFGGKLPDAIGKWCETKAEELNGVTWQGYKRIEVEPTPVNYALSKFASGFGSIMRMCSYGNDDLSFGIPLMAVAGGIATAAMAVTVGIVAAPAIGVIGAVFAGGVTAVAAYPFTHFTLMSGFGALCGSVNMMTMGLGGAAALAYKQKFSPIPVAQPAAPAVPAAAATPAAPAQPEINSRQVMDYIGQLPQADQDKLMITLRDKFPALVERTLEVEWQREQAELQEPQIVKPLDISAVKPRRQK